MNLDSSTVRGWLCPFDLLRTPPGASQISYAAAHARSPLIATVTPLPSRFGTAASLPPLTATAIWVSFSYRLAATENAAIGPPSEIYACSSLVSRRSACPHSPLS
ncbi:hypothetical protein ACOSQ3_018653 [Xanthoceras sorbifolium]